MLPIIVKRDACSIGVRREKSGPREAVSDRAGVCTTSLQRSFCSASRDDGASDNVRNVWERRLCDARASQEERWLCVTFICI